MNYYEEEMHQTTSNNQSDTSLKDQNLQQKLAKSRKNIQSIQAKMQIIRNLSEKIVVLQKKSKNQKINIFELFADKNQIDEDFQNYQKTKLLYLEEKVKGPLFKKYQYVDSSGENNVLTIQKYKNHAKSTLAHTQAHSEISQKPRNKTFRDAKIQTSVIQLNKINYIKAEQNNLQPSLNKNASTQNLQQFFNQKLRKQRKNSEDIFEIAAKQPNNKYEYFSNELFFPETHLPLNSSFSFISEDGQEKQNYSDRKTPLQTERYFKQNSMQIQNFQKSGSEINNSFQNLQQRQRIEISENMRLKNMIGQMQKMNLKEKQVKEQIILQNVDPLHQFKYVNLTFYSNILSYTCFKQKSIQNNQEDQDYFQQPSSVKIQNQEHKVKKLQQKIQESQEKLIQYEDQSAIYQLQIRQIRENYNSISIKYQEIVEQLALTIQSMEILSINFKNKQKEYLNEIKSIQTQNQSLSNTIVAFRNKIKQDGININYSQVQMLQQIINNRQKAFLQEISKFKKESHQKIQQLAQILQNEKTKVKQMETKCLQIISMYDQEIQQRDQEILKLKQQLKNKKQTVLQNDRPEVDLQNKFQQFQLQNFKQLKSQYNSIDYLVLQHKYSRICYQLQQQLQQNLKLKTKFDSQIKKVQLHLESQINTEQSSNKDVVIIEQLTVQLQNQYKKNQFLNRLLTQKQSISAPSQNAKHSQLKNKLCKMRKYAKILQSQIQSIYKVSQCEQHCSIIQKLSKFIDQHTSTSLDKK